MMMDMMILKVIIIENYTSHPRMKNQEERQSLLIGDIMWEEKKIRQRSCLPLKRKI